MGRRKIIKHSSNCFAVMFSKNPPSSQSALTALEPWVISSTCSRFSKERASNGLPWTSSVMVMTLSTLRRLKICNCPLWNTFASSSRLHRTPRTIRLWFCHPQTLLPNLKHFEMEMDHEIELMEWRDVLRGGFRPLTSFRAEVTGDFYDFDDQLEAENYDDVDGQRYLALPLNGLQFDHVILSVKSREVNYKDGVIIDFKKEQRFVEWWSTTFRKLVEHKATIHFTELTFTFSDFLHVEGISLAWRSLDDALCHAMFRGVRAVHFEPRDRRSCITEPMCPALVQKIRLVMPKLSERGVLCFL
ncbi:hypothetical protein BDZ89DRAFT_552020 [Hymenopellis radicata]|nr:hypothetical protein BDZ89DRAFT_552020 [Hymenopellis radicata]